MNQDAEVTRFLARPLERDESDAFADRIEAHFETHGYGLWAVQELLGAPFIGFVGLSQATFDADFTPCVEVGWRLASSHWGQGLATEAAAAAIQDGFDRVALDAIHSFTAVDNLASVRVMDKIGLTRRGAFEHPKLSPGHPLRPHVLYGLERDRWLELQPGLRSSGQVDWPAWRPTVRATLMFVIRGQEVLLIEKKRGLGAGMVNGPGGKLDPGETAEEAARRELFEEVGVRARGDVEERGTIAFQFSDGLAMHVTVFVATDYDGEARETAEAVPLWTRIDDVPYDRMWSDDRHWLPGVLHGGRVSARGVFTGERMTDFEMDAR